MTTRRTFIRQASAAGFAAATFATIAQAAENRSTSLLSKTRGRGPRVKSAVRRDETIVRSGGYGWVSGMTWTADDRFLVGIGEGAEWPGLPNDLQFESGLIDVAGDPQDATFQVVAGYPVLSIYNWFRPGGDPAYYAFGTLAVDNYVYQYLSTFHGSAYFRAGKEVHEHFVFPDLKCTKLIYSTDHGRTWSNQDGTQPVYFEQSKDQSRKSMIFWDEPNSLFSAVILLQMGKGYSGNRDGYVYGYSMANGGSAAELAMFRVPRAQVLAKEHYEYFVARQADGGARWTRDINACAAVHRLPSNWACWSIVHNAPLELYMMTAYYSKGIDDLTDTVEPARLGFWVAPQPWGPWEQIYEESPWRPGGNGTYIAGPHISPKWISNDGKSFWMTWTDWSKTSEISPEYLIELWYASSDKESRVKDHESFLTHANFRFNRQRVDLVI